jgi:hypothetical protein
VKLLTEKFSDYQIILLTHEQDFFELMASNIKGKNDWLIQDFKWSKDTGVEIVCGTIDLKEKIIEKFKNNDVDGLGNDIRKYLEKMMKTVAYNINARVSFRYNDDNEKRMAPELLDVVQKQILKKGNSELKEKANIPKLKGMPMFLGNITSHDNDFSDSIGDLKSVWDEIEKLIKLFIVISVMDLFSMKYFDNVNNKIRCSCGELFYNWTF